LKSIDARSASELPVAPEGEEHRTGLSKEAIKRAFLDNLFYVQGKFPALASRTDYHLALAHVVRDRLLQRWISTASAYTVQGARTVAYLSAEFLMGPHLGNNLVNLGILPQTRQAMTELGLDFDELLYQEEEPGLGNGGLGRLAACFLDSMATLEIPALGYGIRYEFGIFHQEISDGWQVEKTDKWLRQGNPWELVRPEWTVQVKLGGHTERHLGPDGRERVQWIPSRAVSGVPYDTPILGYRTQHREHVAAVARGGRRGLRPRAVQPGGLLRRGEPEGGVREHHEGAVSERRVESRARSCAWSSSTSSCRARLQDMLRIMRTQRLPLVGASTRSFRHPAQRHASGDRGRQS
jgi:glycogen phosphorylase